MSSEVVARPITRCIVVLAAGERLYITDTYQDVYARIASARESSVLMSDEKINNPLSLPLVNVRAVVRLDPDDDSDVAAVDACFNPMHLVAMYRSHPDV